MRRVALLVVLVLAGCSSGRAPRAPTASGGSRPSPATAPATTTATIPTQQGLASDEPCTRSLAAGALPAAVPFHAEDLERMVLTRDDVGGLAGFDSDIGRHGYQGNDELRSIEANPPTTCDDLRRFGRITGFGTAYASQDTVARRVLFSVHLFWAEADARAWADAFVAGMKASVGTPDGPRRFDARPLDALGPGAVAIEHEGREGIRSWVQFVRGPVVGWVVDLHPGARTTIDVVAAAGSMARRVERVSAEAAARPRSGLDAAHLLSAPLPLADFGARYAGLQWNFFFGGCADAAERASIAGEKEAENARRFGRVTGCTAMYEPPEGSAREVVRIFSSVQVFANDAGASGYLANSITDLEADGGRRFDAGRIGDETVGLVTPPRPDAEYTQTRVSLRIGALVASVSIQDKNPRDAQAEVAALARKLYDRVTALLSH